MIQGLYGQNHTLLRQALNSAQRIQCGTRLYYNTMGNP
jgi:hypothetical protein